MRACSAGSWHGLKGGGRLSCSACPTLPAAPQVYAQQIDSLQSREASALNSVRVSEQLVAGCCSVVAL